MGKLRFIFRERCSVFKEDIDFNILGVISRPTDL